MDHLLRSRSYIGDADADGRTAESCAAVPGKRTQVELAGFTVQRRTIGEVVPQTHDAAATRAALPATPILPRATILQLFGRPRNAPAPTSRDAAPTGVHEAAARVTGSSGGTLPYLDAIQKAFGRHDVTGIQAHIGGEAAEAARAMAAEAFATGNHVAFAGAPNLHTAAHEAAHVVQQRGGVQLKGGIGEVGDPHERHADEVADRVVRGASAEDLLDQYGKEDGGSSRSAVQRRAGIEYETSLAARTTAQVNDPGPNAGFVKQDELMYDSTHGWRIVSDNSKLEFVTEPPVDIDQLAPIVNHMLQAIGQLPSPIPAQTPLNPLIPGGNWTKGYTLLPGTNREVSGKPQGTIGIPFEKLYSFFDLLTRYGLTSTDALVSEHEAELKRRWQVWQHMPPGQQKTDRKDALVDAGRQIKKEKTTTHTPVRQARIDEFGKIKGRVDQIVGGLNAQIPDASEREKLKGLLHFVGQYMLRATEHDAGYKKKAFPVMARSSFSSMYGGLGAEAKGQYLAAANALRQQLGIADDAEAFPGLAGSFKIMDWLTSIRDPVNVNIPDEDEEDGFRTVQADLMTAPGAMVQGGSNTDKSMGSMGLDNGLIVLELRSLSHAAIGGSFTLGAMGSLVTDLKNLIERS